MGVLRDVGSWRAYVQHEFHTLSEGTGGRAPAPFLIGVLMYLNNV